LRWVIKPRRGCASGGSCGETPQVRWGRAALGRCVQGKLRASGGRAAGCLGVLATRSEILTYRQSKEGEGGEAVIMRVVGSRGWCSLARRNCGCASDWGTRRWRVALGAAKGKKVHQSLRNGRACVRAWAGMADRASVVRDCVHGCVLSMAVLFCWRCYGESTVHDRVMHGFA
jgi:hypothetical protein